MTRTAAWALVALLALSLPTSVEGQASTSLLVNVHHATPQGCGEWGGGAHYKYRVLVDDVAVETSDLQDPVSGKVEFYDLLRIDIGSRTTARVGFEVLDRSYSLFSSFDRACNLTASDATRFTFTYTIGTPQLVRSAGATEAAAIEVYVSDTTLPAPVLPTLRASGQPGTDRATFAYDAISVPGFFSAEVLVPGMPVSQRGSTTSAAAGTLSITGLRENQQYAVVLRASGGSWVVESSPVVVRTANVAPVAPTVSLGTVGNSTVEVKWSHPDDGHDLQTLEFFVSAAAPIQPSAATLAKSLDMSDPFSASFFSSPVELTDLQPSTSYEAVVRVTDDQGASALSRVLAFRTASGVAAPPTSATPPSTTTPTPESAPTTPTKEPTPTATTTASGSVAVQERAYTYEDLRAAFEVRIVADVNVSREVLNLTPGGSRTVNVVLINHGSVALTVRADGATAMRVSAGAADVALANGFTLTLAASNVTLPPLSRKETTATLRAPLDATVGDEVVFSQALHVSDGRIGGNAFGFDLRARIVSAQVAPVATSVRADAGAGVSTATIVGGVALGGAAIGGFVALRRETVRFALAAALYTRLDRNAVLDHPMRESLQQRIRDRPGICYSDLRRESGLNTGAIVHHLRTLERAGVISSRKEGASRRFYVVGAAPAHNIPVQVSPLTPMQQRVLDLLRATPLTQAELAEKLGLTQQGTSYHVKSLERAGHIQAEYDGRVWRYQTVAETTIVRP